jgi:hypothetical protein
MVAPLHKPTRVYARGLSPKDNRHIGSRRRRRRRKRSPVESFWKMKIGQKFMLIANKKVGGCTEYIDFCALTGG